MLTPSARTSRWTDSSRIQDPGFTTQGHLWYSIFKYRAARVRGMVFKAAFLAGGEPPNVQDIPPRRHLKTKYNHTPHHIYSPVVSSYSPVSEGQESL